MPIQIRFLHTRYPHWGGRSGFTQIARSLDRDRFATVLDGASDSDDDLPRWLTPFKSPLRRVVERGGMPWYKLSDLMAEGRALPGSVSGRHHIVHFLDGEHGGQYLPRLLNAMPLARPRTVASFHQPPHLLRGLVNPRLVRWFDHVTVVSPSQLPFFLEFLPAERVHLLPHGIDTQFFRPPVAPRTAGRRIRCITVGHWLRDWTALRGVAECLREDPDISFDVVTSRTTGLEHLPNVTHHRALSDDALAERYRRADVLLLPLTDCTANNALLEGIASGLPVVSSSLAGVRFHLAGCDALLVAPGDVAALVAAVQRLQRDPARRLAMSQRARWRAEELAWPKAGQAFANLYESIIATPALTRESGALPKQ
jgi:glycosyltransferase involved in cell wall biosynthesis